MLFHFRIHLIYLSKSFYTLCVIRIVNFVSCIELKTQNTTFKSMFTLLKVVFSLYFIQTFVASSFNYFCLLKIAPLIINFTIARISCIHFVTSLCAHVHAHICTFWMVLIEIPSLKDCSFCCP